MSTEIAATFTGSDRSSSIGRNLSYALTGRTDRAREAGIVAVRTKPAGYVITVADRATAYTVATIVLGAFADDREAGAATVRVREADPASLLFVESGYWTVTVDHDPR